MQPAAGKLTFVAVGVFFDEKGMYAHTLADDPDVNKVAELQKSFAKMLEEKANEKQTADVRAHASPTCWRTPSRSRRQCPACGGHIS